MSEKKAVKNWGNLLLFLSVFLIVITHYFLWVRVADPLPDHGGQFEYYYPLLNYQRTALEIGNEPDFINVCGFEYSDGMGLIAWLMAALGRSELLLTKPFLVNLLCIFPFVCTGFFFTGNRKKRFFICLIIAFFPFVQISIKQFSLHGLVVSWTLLALLFFRSWLGCKKWFFLPLFIASFWFAAVLKPSGLLFLLNFPVVYVFWAVINKCFSLKVFFVSVAALFPVIPFYNPDELIPYIKSSLWHNPFIVSHPVAGIVIFVICTVFLVVSPLFLAFYLRNKAGKRGNIPKIFRYQLVFPLILFISCAIMICDLFSPLIIGFSGYCLLLPFIFNYRFRGARGFIYLYAFLSLIPMLMMYRSGIGRMPYIVFLPLLLMLVQVLSENDSCKFRGLYLTLVLLAANFFPSFKTMDSLLGKCGREFYLTLFHGPHQNPLGWHNYGFGALKREFIAGLSNYSFPRAPLFLVENFAPFTSAQFSFYTNVLYKFPPMQILEWVEQGRLYKKLYERYMTEDKGLFDRLYEAGDIPVLFYADRPMVNERGFKPFLLEELIQEDEFSIETENDDLFVVAFNQSLLNYFRDSGRLENDYQCKSIPVARPMAHLCVDKRIPLAEAENDYDYGKNYLREIIRRRAQYVLDRAWGDLNNGKPQKAHEWLLRLSFLRLNPEEFRHDIDTIAQTLWDKYGYNIYTARVRE